jgi:tetratricopeptide (TPR) repeat protein
VPRRLQDLLDARLARLPAPLLQVLPALAVLEDGFSADELAAVAGLPVAQARARLATGAREDLLEEDARGWRVRHPLLREAARGRTTGDELVRAHDAAATALARRDAAPERIAYHLLRAGRGREATPHLIAAARHAGAVGAYADGRRWVDAALRQADDAQKGVLFALLGDLRFATGDRTALSAYASALRHAPDEVQPDLKSKQGLAAIALGDLDGAEQALAGLPAGTVAQRARASVVMAILAWYRGDIDRSAGLVEQADALAAAAGEEVAMLADVRAMVAHAQGRWDAHANWELSEVWHLPQLAGRVFDAYLCVTEYVLHSGDPYERLIGFASDLRGQAVQAGARRGEAFSATVLGEAQLLRGDAEAARAALGDAVRISREVGAVAGEALARARLGEALFALGDPAGARAHLEEALELSHASSLASHLLFLVHAPLLRVQDDLDAALALVASSSVLLEDLAACNFCPVTYALAAGSVCARAGEPDRAEAFLERAERSAGLWPPGVWSPAVCEVRGEILVARGAPDAGITLRRALEGYAASGQGLNERRVRETIAGMAG